ncbi:MAG: aminodeoxychorismate synthase component I [Pseudomonadales bacterium]
MKNRLYVKELRYTEDSTGYFSKLCDLPLPVWLDSNGSARGRYDILSADPSQWLSANAGLTRLDSAISSETFAEEPLGVLTRLLSQTGYESHPGLPFSGGAIGYLSYDLGRCYESLPTTALNDYSLPDCIIGIYDWALVQDHKLRKSHFVCQHLDARAQLALNRFEALDNITEHGDFALTSKLRGAWPFADYSHAFDRVQDYIQAGDCYQINLSQRYSASYQGDPTALYLKLRKQTSAPFSAYFGCGDVGDRGDCSIVSFSPERFLNVEGKRVATQPIKGTAPRAADPATDAANARWLCNSEKDRAENLMIVDLLRNDIGKSCEPGSITVPQLFELQSFASVHHLVSTVQGRLRPELHAMDALRSAFPGGSITGAPKLRAMEIIEELEPYWRSVYCGSMFYAGYNGNMDSSIMIRTILCNAGQLYCWGGGGIVADSTVEAEYQEIEDKIGRLLKTLRAS